MKKCFFRVLCNEALLLLCGFVIGEKLSEDVALCELRVEENQLYAELSTIDSARVVKGITFAEEDGVVTISARIKTSF